YAPLMFFFYISVSSLYPHCFVLFSCSRHLRHLHSFPTRRSSDLCGDPAAYPLHTDHGPFVIHMPYFATNAAGTIFDDFEGAKYGDRKSTRLNSSHGSISYAVFCLKKKKKKHKRNTIETRIVVVV